MSETPETPETPAQLPPTLIIRSRLRAIAKTKGKVLSTSFLALIDQEVREMVEQACHMVGSRTIVKANEFREYRALLRGLGARKK